MTHKSKAHTNIALVKYWGKKESKDNLPINSSISLTLDNFYTITSVTYDKNLKQDELKIDDIEIQGIEFLRVTKFMDRIREMYKIPYYAYIDSKNHVPKKAGLASSSSAFAALAHAALKAYGINVSDKELSTLARIGSGSASRSVFGGFVIWEEGTNHETSYAYTLKDAEEYALIVCMVDKKEKSIDSRSAMLKLNEFPELKEEWIENTKYLFEEMKEAILEDDLERIGSIAESHANLMHYVIQETGVTFLTDKSFEIMDLTEKIRLKGLPVFYTMDAGPNVKILTKKKYVSQVLPYYEKVAEILVCYQGGGIESI